MPAIAPGPYERQRRPGGHGRERRGDHRGPAQHLPSRRTHPGCSRRTRRAGPPRAAVPARPRRGADAAVAEPVPTGRPTPSRARPPPTRPAAARAQARGPAARPSAVARPAAPRGRTRPPRTGPGAAGTRRRARVDRRLTRTPVRSRPVPPSTRPGTATTSRTRRRPSGSVPVCTTRSTLVATAGTTKSLVTFGRREQRQQAQLADRGARGPGMHAAHPRDPRAESQQHVEALLLAHLADDEAARSHAQRLDDQPAQPDLALAFEVRLPGLHRDDVGQERVQLEDLLARDQPYGGGERVEQSGQEGGLAGLGRAGDHDAQPAGDRRGEEPGRGLGQRAQPDEVVQVRTGATNLRMLTAQCPGSRPGSRRAAGCRPAAGRRRTGHCGPPGGRTTPACARRGAPPRPPRARWLSARCARRARRRPGPAR